MARRNRAYYRDVRRRKIAHRKRLIHKMGDYWYYEHEGSLDKGKIFCSCGLCMNKTKNKGKRRKIHANYAPSYNWKHSDKQKIESAEDQLDSYFEREPAD